LRSPDFTKPWVILTDCSAYQMGAVLCQLDENGREHPVCYASCSLTEAQQKYGITDREGLAVVWAVRLWRHYLYGSPVVVVTDHSALISLITKTEFTNQRMARYAIDLSEFDLTIVHRAGAIHHGPDALSRFKMCTDPVELKRRIIEAWSINIDLIHGTEVELGHAEHNFSDSMLYDPLVVKAQIKKQIDDATVMEDSENGTQVLDIDVRELVARLQAEHQDNSKVIVDEFGCRATDMYNMVAPVENSITVSDRISMSQIRQEQRNDRWCRHMYEYLVAGTLPEDTLEANSISAQGIDFHIESDHKVVMRQDKLTPADELLPEGIVGRSSKIYMPPSLRSTLIELIHTVSPGGHPKDYRMIQLMLPYYWWPNMLGTVKTWCKLCGTCNKQGDKNRKAMIQGHIRAIRPRQKWVVDLVYLPRESGGRYCLTAIDVYSRWGIAVPIKDKDSNTVMNILYGKIIEIYGPFEELVSDQGSEFKDRVDEMLTACNIKHTLSAAYHSESHGIIERFNKSFVRILAQITNENGTDWPRMVGRAVLSYNGIPHAAIGMLTPAKVFLGHDFNFNIPIVDDGTTVSEHVRLMGIELEKVHNYITKEQDKYYENMDKSREKSSVAKMLRKFKIDDLVMRFRSTGNRTKDKLMGLKEGPYRIIGYGKTDVDYILHLCGSTKQPVQVHVDDISEFRGKPVEVSKDLVIEPATESTKYEVERVIDERKTDEGREYEVKWEGFDDTTWEPEENLNFKGKTKSNPLVKWNSLNDTDRVELKTKYSTIVASVIPQQIILDLAKPPAEKLIEQICDMVGVSINDVMLVWCSPPCTTNSRMNRVNSHRTTEDNPCGCGYRDFNTDRHEPCCSNKSCKYSELAREHDNLISHIIKAVTSDRERGRHYEVAIENPLGTLRKRVDILANRVWSLIADRKTVDYCAYDHEFQKRTDIFSTLKDWFPRGTTGSGLCEGKCKHGSQQLKYKHFENMHNVTGSGSSKRKNAIPYKLLAEIVKSAKEKQPNKKIIIDLCSGYQSMRQVARNYNLIYIPVDVKDYSTYLKVPPVAKWTHLILDSNRIWRPFRLIRTLPNETLEVEYRCKTTTVNPTNRLIKLYDKLLCDQECQQ
ncbi:MAG: DDE-type integrase/transposase/recombinase, partial [Flavobacteriales bacterium]|nr:DDE-type integrase/transposase/recombinase [Flavobacteriales bacterium]